MKKQTIAQRLKVKDFPFQIKDNKGNILYHEDSDGYWTESTYDSKGNELTFKKIQVGIGLKKLMIPREIN